MKKPDVDYTKFKLSKINSPEFEHLKFLFGWVGYFAFYFITEMFIPYESCTSVHSFLDDLIPFCEYFVIAYTGWYFLIVATLIYFALYNTDLFKKFMTFIIVTQVVAMAVYIIFPNRQDLRPEVFPRDNVFTDILALIYRFDTSTNVCPSLHVAYSVGIASAWIREPSVSKLIKTVIAVFCFFVCISVAFVKQHSVIDIFAAIPLCMLAEYIAFYRGCKTSPDRKKVETS